VVNEDREGERARSQSPSRRGLLRAAGAGVAGLLVAGCGGESLRLQANNSAPVLDTDIDLLNQLLHLEHIGIAAYTAGTPLLAPAVTKAGALFLNDELSHAGALAGLVKAAGGKPIKQEPSYPLGHPRNSREVLELLHAIENMQISAYLGALTRLSPGFVKQSVVSIMANDAQHVAVVRAALHQPAVPSAFVTGRD
jgi:hypothetical protein